jgi:hypothetical protein
LSSKILLGSFTVPPQKPLIVDDRGCQAGIVLKLNSHI